MQATPPTLRTNLFRPGQRVAVAVSGGADSVALLRRLLEECAALGITLSVAHVHHGIRGGAADEDAAFVSALAERHALPFYLHRTDAPAAADALHESLEEAARNLRYAFFRELMAAGHADAVTTAHTLDDQAETVLHKLLRGAWTEGLSGVHPVLDAEGGPVLRPFLENTHACLTAWLAGLPQAWREDETNRDMAYTRNRIRWQLLPMLRTFNPRIAEQLARLASISADEEAYWQRELARLLPALLLPGKPVRGGGRSTSTHPDEETVAIERTRLRELHPAVARRVLRAAARRLGARLSFDHTEQFLAMTLAEQQRSSTRGTRLELPGGLVAERSLREVRLSRTSGALAARLPAYVFFIPGEVHAPEYGLRLQGERVGTRTDSETGLTQARATLRSWRPGDRVTLQHSRGPKKVAEVLDRLHVAGDERTGWPVVELEGAILWMRGVQLEGANFRFTVQLLDENTPARE